MNSPHVTISSPVGGADHRRVVLAASAIAVDPSLRRSGFEAENVVDLTEPVHRPVFELDDVRARTAT